MTYGEAITKRVMGLCKEREITLNKLATLSGIKQSTLENIVKGNTKNPSLRTLHRVAQGLGMKLSELLDFAEINEGVLEDE